MKVSLSDHQLIYTGDSPRWLCSIREPVLFPIIFLPLHKLLQSSAIASCTFCGKTSRVCGNGNRHRIHVCYEPSRRTEDSRINRTREMLDIVFSVWKCQWMRRKEEQSTAHSTFVIYRFLSSPGCTSSRWNSAVRSGVVHIMGLACRQDHQYERI